MPDSPYVVTVASEKGGVGKTTIATNLAVYLKALREDLPVTIASFDNHFSVDNMFALGRRPDSSVAGLFAGIPAADLAVLGEYGVQYIPSERNFSPPVADAGMWRNILANSRLAGILILDTRPILDDTTRCALLAADLVLVPVKDRPSLVNAASLQRVLATQGSDPARLWLIPSLVDARLRLRGNIGVRDFLSFFAQERGFQVLATFIAKSPKVEGLATNLTSRVYPVITHARSTAVHRQFGELAAFVLKRFDETGEPFCRQKHSRLSPAGPAGVGTTRSLPADCPGCGEPIRAGQGYFFQDLRSRRRGFLHTRCLHEPLREAGLEAGDTPPGMVVLRTAGPGFAGEEAELTLHFFDPLGDELMTEKVADPARSPFASLLQGAAGKPFEDFDREILVIALEDPQPTDVSAGEGRRRFSSFRRKVLREVLGREK